MKVSHLHSSCQRLTAHVDQGSNAVPVGEAGSEVTDDGLESLTVLPQLSFCFAQGEREPPDLCLADGMLAGRPTGKSVPASTVSAASVKALRAACRSSSSPLSSKCPHGRAHSRAAREGVLGPSHTAWTPATAVGSGAPSESSTPPPGSSSPALRRSRRSDAPSGERDLAAVSGVVAVDLECVAGRHRDRRWKTGVRRHHQKLRRRQPCRHHRGRPRRQDPGARPWQR